MSALPDSAFAQLFTQARTHSNWLSKQVSDATLQQLYDVFKYGPTSANCSPARIVFVKSHTAKEKLKPALAEGNVAKTMAAPVTVIVAMDLQFYEQLPILFPHTDAKAWFVGNSDLIASTAFRNSSLQGAYLMLAARALGLDCGPMSGFDNARLDAAFFPEGNIKSNFLCNLGYGDTEQLHARGPRLSFDVACQIV